MADLTAVGAADPEGRYYTVREVADSLKMSVRWVLEMIYSGELVAYQFGSVYRIAEADLVAFREARRGRMKEKGKNAGEDRKGRR